jgi:hypothetical protein
MAFGTMVNCARCSLRTIVIAAWSPPASPDAVDVPTSTASASRAAARVIVVRGRWPVGLARIYRVSDRPMSERCQDLVQRRVSRAWPPRPSIQSVTYLVKYERPNIALFYAMARLANDARLAPGRSVTPDFAAHARRLLAPLGQPHKIYDSEPCPL